MLVEVVCTGRNPEGWRDLVHGFILEPILYICPVFYAEVTLLRREGRRLPQREWPAPVYGLVRVQDNAHGNFRRLMRSLTLHEQIGVGSVRHALSLYDPYFLPSADGALLIAGIELCSAAGQGVREHGQVWLCRTRAHHDESREPLSALLDRHQPET